MKIKTIVIEGVTYAVLDDKGNPVYIHENGQEAGFDAKAAAEKITALNGEAQGHREAKENAEKALKPFEGLDATKARKALETVSQLDEGALVAAGKVEEIKRGATEAAEAQFRDKVTGLETRVGELETTNAGLISHLDTAIIGGAFARSEYLQKEVAIPPSFMEARFRASFKVEDGKLVGYGLDGKKLLSHTRVGEPADFDEAMTQLVAQSPDREHIIKGGVKGGGGADNPQNLPGGVKNPWSKDTFNRTEQARLLTSNPALAKQLAAAEGVNLQIE